MMRYFLLAAAAGMLAACETPPPRPVHRPLPQAVRQAPPPVQTQVYFYPKAAQSPEQQSRDRYECYLWAVKQTGFDPSRPGLAPQQRIEYVPAPQTPRGHDTAVGAVAGAVIGAVVARPGHEGAGAAVGAVAGAVAGAASDASRQAEADRMQDRYDRRYTARNARTAQQAADYRRAMSACLEGRNYAVQ